MKTLLHGPMDCAKTLKLRFRVGDLDLPERRKRFTSIRVEEEGAKRYPCGNEGESRNGKVGDCELPSGGTECLKCRRKLTNVAWGSLVH